MLFSKVMVFRDKYINTNVMNTLRVSKRKGFERKLLIVGVGYSAAKQGKKLVLKLGYSHPIELEDPEGITTETPDANTILIKGIDKAQVGNYAADIRAWRPPEPYKGKGVLYDGEVVHKKEGKSGAA